MKRKTSRRKIVLAGASFMPLASPAIAQISCGPPPPSNPQKRKGGEAFPPLPLPVTPLRRSEKKKPPAPPTLMAKVNYGVEKIDDKGNKFFDWTTDPGDTKNLFHYARRRMGINYKAQTVRMNDYAFDPRTVPCLYFTGHEAFALTPEYRSVLRRYVNDGGFIFGDACCGSTNFADSFTIEMMSLFPDRPWHVLPPEHPVFHSFDKIKNVNFQEGKNNHFKKRPMLEGINFGCRTAVILTRADLSCGWDGHTHPHGLRILPGDSKKVGVNLLAYWLSYYRLGRTLSVQKQYRDLSNRPREIQVAQLRHSGDWDPSPTAISNLLKEVAVKTSGDVKYSRVVIDPETQNLGRFPFILLTGHLNFTLSKKGKTNLKNYLENGGFLFISNCCNRIAFDQAVRREFSQLFKGRPFQSLKKGHPIFHSHHDLTKVPASASAWSFGKLIIPSVEGIEINSSYPIIYCSQSPLTCWDGQERPFIDLMDPRIALRVSVNALVYAITS